MRPKIADSYVPHTYADLMGVGVQAMAASVWPVANKALYLPVTFPYPCQLYSIAFVAVNGTGNYDLGFYDGYSKVRIASSGSTAMTAAGAKTLTFTTDIRVDPGKLYYAALALSSTSGSVERNNSAVPALIALGCAEQATALPLPSPMVPVTLVAAYMPLFVFGVR
jgi:hypothetical protein